MQKAFEKEAKDLEIQLETLKEVENIDLANEGDDMTRIDQDALKRSLGYIKQDTIHVSNLPYKCDVADITNLFSDSGSIKNVTIPVDRATDMNKGFGFVTFETEKAAKKAVLTYNGHMFYKRKLKISIAEKRSQDFN